MLDISNHVVSDMNLSLPADSKELFDLLATHKILSARLSERPAPMAGFRNILVHEYLEIDRHRVYRALKRDLGDFERFIRALSRLM